MKYRHPMLEKSACPDCEPGREGFGIRPRAILVRDACTTCLGRGEVFSLGMEDMRANSSYRVGELRLHKDKLGIVRGRFDQWLPAEWQTIDSEAGLQSMLWSCAALFREGKTYEK